MEKFISVIVNGRNLEGTQILVYRIDKEKEPEDGNFWIEDQSLAGTYVNGIKIEKNVKKFVKVGDTIIAGTKNTKLNLNEPKIQELLKL